MSERGSFTTNYIYSGEDYRKVREALERDNGKFCAVAPPVVLEYDEQTVEAPIVQGKVGALYRKGEIEEISDRLDGLRTKEKITVVVICDCGSIEIIEKDPGGDVEIWSPEKTTEEWE